MMLNVVFIKEQPLQVAPTYLERDKRVSRRHKRQAGERNDAKEGDE